MKKLLIVTMAAALALTGSAAHAIINLPAPDEAAAPQLSPQEIEQQRDIQQSEAPRQQGLTVPKTTDPAASGRKPAPAANGSVQGFDRTFAAHEAAEAPGGTPVENSRSSGRTRGIVLTVLGVAGMLVLGGGRAVVNVLSRTQAQHEEEDARVAEADENERSYGGEHSHYIID